MVHTVQSIRHVNCTCFEYTDLAVKSNFINKAFYVAVEAILFWCQWKCVHHLELEHISYNIFSYAGTSTIATPATAMSGTTSQQGTGTTTIHSAASTPSTTSASTVTHTFGTETSYTTATTSAEINATHASPITG
jgi:hypothetical protein